MQSTRAAHISAVQEAFGGPQVLHSDISITCLSAAAAVAADYYCIAIPGCRQRMRLP